MILQPSDLPYRRHDRHVHTQAADPSAGQRRAHPAWLSSLAPPPCENFLYGFKAARRAARAAATAPWPSLPLALPLRPGQRRSAGAKSMKPGRLTYSKFHLCTRGVPAPAAGIVRGRSEPVKAVCDRRATAPVELPGERTREDGLDRTCPDQEMAAIGSRDTSGQGLDA